MNINCTPGIQNAIAPPGSVRVKRATDDASNPGNAINPGSPTVPDDTLLGNAARTGAPPPPDTSYQTHREMVASMEQKFPDIVRQAKIAIEAQIKKDHGLALDADQCFYNVFSADVRTGPSLQALGNGAYEGRAPSPSMTLAQAQIWALTQGLPDTIAEEAYADAGIYTEGRPCTSFGPHNKVALSAAQFLRAARDSGFIAQYEEALRNYWQDNIGALSMLAELNVFDYASHFRRAGHREVAMGLPGDSDLSDAALAMLTTAAGRSDPDLPTVRIDMFGFDINGWPSTDIVWLRNTEGRIVLYIPGAPAEIHEYANLGEMRAGVRAMIGSPGEREWLATHFSDADRRNSLFYDGVDKWLLTLANDTAGTYDYAIARSPRRLSGTLVLPEPGPRASELLSDQALTMLAEAAHWDTGAIGNTHHTQAHVFDIAGIPAVDMMWLQAADGRVVLLMPHSEDPIREYPDLQAMRDDVVDMLERYQGRRSLLSHFSLSQQDGSRYPGGLLHWLDEIGKDPEHNSALIVDAAQDNTIPGNVFAALVSRLRDEQFERLATIGSTSWPTGDTASQQRQWSKPLTTQGMRVLYDRGGTTTLAETQKQSQPALPGMQDGPRIALWAQALALRLASYQHTI